MRVEVKEQIDKLQLELKDLKSKFKFLCRNDKEYKLVRDSIISIERNIDNLIQQENRYNSFFD